MTGPETVGAPGGAHPLDGWTPVKVTWPGGRPVVRWRFTEGIDFTDPFFDQTINRCVQDPFRLLFWRETDMEALAELAVGSPGCEPAGFIFHLSRCGSTLLTQMLAGLSSTLVMSEPGPLDQVMRAQMTNPGVSDGDLVEWLRWMVSALGQRRSPAQTRSIVKFDAWAVRHWPLIRRAFPAVPCIFVYRDPVEVLVSQLADLGYHMMPGTLPPAWFGLAPSQVMTMGPEQYCSAVLAGLCDSALHGAREGALQLIHYDSLPDAVADIIAPCFGIDVGPTERTTFTRVSARDAKNPAQPFTSDTAAKQRRASASVRAAAETWVGPAYEALEALRLGPT